MTNIGNPNDENHLQTPLKLLVVDDDPSMRGLIREAFVFDYQIIEAEDVNSAITKLNENQVAISLIDYNMPKQTGMALLEVMKDEFLLTRKIMLTGNKEKSLVIEAINTGKVHAFINKPFDIEELKSVLKEQSDIYREEIADHHKIQEYDDLVEIYNHQIANVNSTLIDTLVKENENEISINQIIIVIDELKGSLISVLKSEGADHLSDEFKQSFHQYLSRISSIIDNLSKEYQLEFLEFFSYFNKVIMAQLLERSHLSRKYSKILEGMRKDNELLQVYDDILDEIQVSDPVELMVGFLEIDITDTLRVETLKKHHVPYPTISFLVIMKNDLPIYSFQGKSSSVDTYLISNFFVAANVFAKEVFNSNSVNTILMDKYILIFRRVSDEALYVIQADYETIKLRMNFEIFIEQSIDLVDQIQPNIGITKEETDQLEELCKTIILDF